MPTEVLDKKGNEIQVGDEVIVRAKVVAITPLGDQTLLRVEWQTDAWLIDFVKAEEVEKL